MAQSKPQTENTEVKPFSPSDVEANRIYAIHPDIINVVNELLCKNYRSGSATILQKEIVAAFMKKNPRFNRSKLTDDGHLDFEPLYRQQGWTVVYDKPGYNETYDASFRFTKNK